MAKGKTKVEHRPHKSISLGVGPEIVKPVITNGESGTEFGEIEKMNRIPTSTVAGTERYLRVVTRGGLIPSQRLAQRDMWPIPTVNSSQTRSAYFVSLVTLYA